MADTPVAAASNALHRIVQITAQSGGGFDVADRRHRFQQHQDEPDERGAAERGQRHANIADGGPLNLRFQHAHPSSLAFPFALITEPKIET